jgi:hypothetical protein
MSYNVSVRTNSGRFILDGNNQWHSLPVLNDVDGSNLVQIVNPFMAYLSVYWVLYYNSDKLSDAGYVIWDGSIDGFTVHATVGDIANRFEITTTPAMSDPAEGFIPPLQSFFVQKKTTAPLGTITISPHRTYTVIPDYPGNSSPYKLRAGAQETNILRVKAVQDKRVSYAVLHYNESTSPAYSSKEDMHKLFYQLEDNVIPLEVYSCSYEGGAGD